MRLPLSGRTTTAARYESLIRIANSIRVPREPEELFNILVHELGQAIQYDGIAQFDESANKVNWHFGTGCRKRDRKPSEIDREEPGCTGAGKLCRLALSTPRRDLVFPPAPCERRACSPCALFP